MLFTSYNHAFDPIRSDSIDSLLASIIFSLYLLNEEKKNVHHSKLEINGLEIHVNACDFNGIEIIAIFGEEKLYSFQYRNDRTKHKRNQIKPKLNSFKSIQNAMKLVYLYLSIYLLKFSVSMQLNQFKPFYLKLPKRKQIAHTVHHITKSILWSK